MVKPGSKGMEIFLWSLFPLGIPYTIWRFAKKTGVCKNCDSSFLVTTDSALGSRILENLESVIASRKTITQNDFHQFVGVAKQVDLAREPVVNPIATPKESTIHAGDDVVPNIKLPTPQTVIDKPRTKPDPNQW